MAGTVPVAKSLKDIYTEDTLQPQISRWEQLLKTFKTNYGHSAEFVARSPGRVNIIGEHIDYSLYAVLPMAITADALLAVSPFHDVSSSNSFKIKISRTSSPQSSPPTNSTSPMMPSKLMPKSTNGRTTSNLACEAQWNYSGRNMGQDLSQRAWRC